MGAASAEKPEAWPDVQPFDGQQRAVGRSRLFKVGDTDAAYGNAEGKRVDRKGFDGDGGVDGLRELAFHDAAQHRRRQGNRQGRSTGRRGGRFRKDRHASLWRNAVLGFGPSPPRLVRKREEAEGLF